MTHAAPITPSHGTPSNGTPSSRVTDARPLHPSPFPTTAALALEQASWDELERTFVRGSMPDLDGLVGGTGVFTLPYRPTENAIEAGQAAGGGLTSFRAMENDWIADALGVWIGVLILWAVQRWVVRPRLQQLPAMAATSTPDP